MNKKNKRECRNGPKCHHLASGSCFFYHPEVEARAAVPSSTASSKCPKCGAAMVLKQNFANNSEFWACPNYPGCKSTKAISDHKCDSCGSGMVKRNGEYGEFFGCSRYPACHNKWTMKEFTKQQNSTKSIEQLDKEGLLKTADKDTLVHFCRTATPPIKTTGTKDEIILRIQRHFHPLSPDEQKLVDEQERQKEEAKKKDKEDKKQQKLKEQREEEERRQKELERFERTCIVPAIKLRPCSDYPKYPLLAHSITGSSWPQKQGNRYDCYGVGQSKAYLTTENDFAVGLSAAKQEANIVFYAPNSAQVLSVLPDVMLSSVLKTAEAERCIVNKFSMDGAKEFQLWTEIYEEDGHVHVLQREGRWTDSETDWDVTFYIPKSHGQPGGLAWGYKVPKEIYQEAWATFLKKVVTVDLAAAFASDPNFNGLTQEELFNMKVGELREQLKIRNMDSKGLKADLYARLLAHLGWSTYVKPATPQKNASSYRKRKMEELEEMYYSLW